VQKLEHPRQIQIAGRRIQCETADDRTLLMQARSIEVDSSSAARISEIQLYLIKDACQRYSLGKHQRIVNNAIKLFGR
jgi:hypothetical protein